MPWRNGGGSTREVAIDPPDATPNAPFRWRISCASVGSDGPFSTFPGIDRSLWLLRGGGVQLDVDGRQVRLERPLERIDFAGEASVHAHLLAGAIEDLNVFVERATTIGAADVFNVPSGSSQALPLSRGTTVLLVVEGALQVTGVAATPVPLGTGDALRVNVDNAMVVVGAGVGAATVLVASFVQRQRA